MVENCYILYSCDGSYEPIVSNYSGLSAYSASFVSITINNSLTPDSCFYVLDLGVIDCDPTYDIETNSGVTCSCECYCYFIKSVNQDTDVTYVNCSGQIVVDTLAAGFTYNICSKVYPQFDSGSQIPLKLTDICQNGQCPPTIPTVKPANECDVITIFPMGVECFVQQPSSDVTFDGATTLVVTGGTPPYTIFWEMGSFAPALTNLGVGEYSATITDYYNDFTAFTTCVLTAETTTYSGMCFVVTGISLNNPVYISTDSLGLKNGKPYYKIQYGATTYGYVFWDQSNDYWVFCDSLDCQGTPYNELEVSGLYPVNGLDSWVKLSNTQYYITESYNGTCQIPIIPKVDPQLCVTLFTASPNFSFGSEMVRIQLNPSSYINGLPSWTSVTDQYLIYWNTGSTPSQWTMTGYSNPSVNLINNDPSDPPLSNWQVYGSPTVYSMEVTEGICSEDYDISVNAIVNDALCGLNGSITVQAYGGEVPYQYSINGGLTYQSSPMFNGLVDGTYVVFVQDNNSVVGSLPPVQITSVPSTNYTLTLNVNYGANTFSIVAPTLPPGATITFDLVQNSLFSYYPDNIVPTPTYNNITTITGFGPMTLTNTSTNILPLSGPCTFEGDVNTIQLNNQYTNTLTINSNQTITGSITNSITNFPERKCAGANGSYNLTITNGVINNCECCTLNLVNTVPPEIL